MKVITQETLYEEHGATLKHKCGKRIVTLPLLSFYLIFLPSLFLVFLFFFFFFVRSLIPTCGGIIVSIILSSLGHCSKMNNDDHHTSIHWCASVVNKKFFTPFRDGIWNCRRVSVCDRVSFPHDPEIVRDRPSWDTGWGRL